MTYPNGAAPQKSKTLVWVALGMGIVFVLLLIAGGVLGFILLNGKDKEASEPNEGTSTSAPAPQPKPAPRLAITAGMNRLRSHNRNPDPNHTQIPTRHRLQGRTRHRNQTRDQVVQIPTLGRTLAAAMCRRIK